MWVFVEPGRGLVTSCCGNRPGLRHASMSRRASGANHGEFLYGLKVAVAANKRCIQGKDGCRNPKLRFSTSPIFLSTTEMVRDLLLQSNCN